VIDHCQEAPLEAIHLGQAAVRLVQGVHLLVERVVLLHLFDRVPDVFREDAQHRSLPGGAAATRLEAQNVQGSDDSSIDADRNTDRRAGPLSRLQVRGERARDLGAVHDKLFAGLSRGLSHALQGRKPGGCHVAILRGRSLTANEAFALRFPENENRPIRRQAIQKALGHDVEEKIEGRPDLHLNCCLEQSGQLGQVGAESLVLETRPQQLVPYRSALLLLMQEVKSEHHDESGQSPGHGDPGAGVG